VALSAALVDLQDSKISCNRGIQTEGVCEPNLRRTSGIHGKKVRGYEYNKLQKRSFRSFTSYQTSLLYYI
jgi:hypothetical protein